MPDGSREGRSAAGESKAIDEEVYDARGDMENWIQEQQSVLFSARTSCHAFHANHTNSA